MNKIIALAGPTAVGKTKFAIKLADEFDGEIVSCDSMQLYKYMDIGSAKPTPEEMEQASPRGHDRSARGIFGSRISETCKAGDI